MLPKAVSSSPAGRRQHRRQISTPTAAHSQRLSPYPSSQQRREASHRRGMSLDFRQLQTTSSATSQQYSPNSNTNHAGLATIPQHHVLQEAQQHSQQARPGPGSQQANFNTTTNLTHSFSDSYLVSPHGTPQPSNLDPSCLDTNQFDLFALNANSMMQNGQLNLGNGLMIENNFDMMAFPQMQSDQRYVQMADHIQSGRQGRRISNGIADQVNKFERMEMQAGPRASTPPFQTQNTYLPLTPTETPNDRMEKHAPRLDRFTEDYDESLEETIRPSRKQTNSRSLAIFTDGSRHADSPSRVSTPANTSFSQLQSAPGSAVSDHFSQAFMQNNGSIRESQSGRATPTTPHQMHFSAPFDGTPSSTHSSSLSRQGTPASVRHLAPSQSMSGSMPNTPTANRGTPHRRTESLASIQSAASISDINFDDQKMETGVTLNDIAKYIDGPDLTDGRWTCTFEGCNKKFGRKENIKSHVQTHLNDRQYQCPSCSKCFVRQHDLKRHAKIHTGVKPYPCECGNSFARHDALTRHKQRGMCVGAFEGVVKRNAKRGRPRKPRPGNEERQEKASRTRRKNNLSTSSVSSAYDSATDSSAATTPFGSQASPLPAEDNILDAMLDLSGGAEPYDNSASSSAPMPSFTFPAVTNQHRVEAARSPSAASPESFVSPQLIMDNATPNLSSPASSQPSHVNTPAADMRSQEDSGETDAPFLSVDADISGLPDLSASSSVATSAALEDCPPFDYSGQEIRNYMAFADQSVGSLDKFDELFGDSGFEPNFNDPIFLETDN